MNKKPQRPRGVFAPVVTPFNSDLSINLKAFTKHCKFLQDSGVGLAIFGTNSEATSLCSAERKAALEHLLASDIKPTNLMPGTGCSSIPETVELTAHAIEAGVPNVLVLPPYFYKDLSDDGLFTYYSEVIERVKDDSLRIYLYHIPSLTQVPITVGLIERLLRRYPKTIAGLKDSSGDWENTKRMLAAFATSDFDVFCASEIFLSETLRLGGAGCISATANVNPMAINELFRCVDSIAATKLQFEVDQVRRVFQSYPMIAAMKYFLMDTTADMEWLRVRPPLTAFTEAEGKQLMESLKATTLGSPARLMDHSHPSLSV